MDDKIEFLSIHVLREPKNKLRIVDRESVEYLELRDSLREKGFLNSILVRPLGSYYEIVDGLCRVTAAKDECLERIPCIIRQISDDEVLALQIQANAISLETKPAEYALQLKKLMRESAMTQSQVACLIRKSPAWVGKCLSLSNLLVNVQKMVDRGEIPLQNAYMLAKIPRSMQKDYVDNAKLMSQKEFTPIAAACVKQFMEAVKKGKMDAFYEDKFEAVAHLRSLKEIEEGRNTAALICVSEGCQSALDGFNAALRWVCHLDQKSVREQETIIRERRERRVLDVSIDE